MTARQSIKRKPKRPRKDFPLFPHDCGQWVKKINGKLHYFGTWDDPEAAERKYDAQKKQLREGKPPRKKVEACGQLKLSDLLNSYLESQEQRLTEGEISKSSFRHSLDVCKRLIEVLTRDAIVEELGPSDFALVKREFSKRLKSPNSMRTAIKVARASFNFGVDHGLINSAPIYGKNFAIPSQVEIRKHAAKKKQVDGGRTFTAPQCWKLITSANPSLKAMIFLGLNCGLGNNDCATICFNNLDLKGGWLDFPRPKTAVDRACRLWPETVDAISDWLEHRPKPAKKEFDQLVFLTRYGNPLRAENGKSSKCHIAQNFRALLDRTEIYRKGLSFYSLRHTHRTWSDGAGDPPVANLMMGHVDATMGANYRHEISDVRLFRVSKYVRGCLYERSSRHRTPK